MKKYKQNKERDKNNNFKKKKNGWFNLINYVR